MRRGAVRRCARSVLLTVGGADPAIACLTGTGLKTPPPPQAEGCIRSWPRRADLDLERCLAWPTGGDAHRLGLRGARAACSRSTKLATPAPAWAQRNPAMRHIARPVGALGYRPRRSHGSPCQNSPATGCIGARSLVGYPIRDTGGTPAKHAKTTVGDVRLHDVMACAGEPVVLLHRIRRRFTTGACLIPPAAVERYTVIAIDIGGRAASRPLDGFDMWAVAGDVAALMTTWGTSASGSWASDGARGRLPAGCLLPRPRAADDVPGVLLPGFGLEEWSFLTPANVRRTTALWHVGFSPCPEPRGRSSTGREEMYLTWCAPRRRSRRVHR